MIDHEEWRKSLNRRAQVEEEMFKFERELRKGFTNAPLAQLSAEVIADKLHDWATRLGVPQDWKTYGKARDE